MLSARSSFMATNCPDTIFAASFAVIGGKADDRTTALSCLPLTPLLPTPLTGRALDADASKAGRVARDWAKLDAPLTDVPP